MGAAEPLSIRTCRARGAWVQVTLDHGEAARLPDEVALRHGLRSGAALAAERWAEILAEAEHVSCRRAALRLLERRAHAEAELGRKLRQRRFPAPVVRETIAHLRQLALVNDREFARQYADEQLRRGSVGPLKVKAGLQQRGVPRAIIDEVLAAEPAWHDEDAALERARDLARRKWAGLHRVTDPQARQQKVLRFLAGRGFPLAVCYEALAVLNTDE